MKAYTCVCGNNADLFAEVDKIYPFAGKTVVDATYGKGIFWRKLDMTTFNLIPFDIAPRFVYVRQADLREIPLENESADVVVLDPPYKPDAGKTTLHEGTYKNRETTKGMNYEALKALYGDGIKEGGRLLKPCGLLMVKCQDLVHSGKQHRSSIYIWSVAAHYGLDDQDQFILCNGRPPIQHKKQKHARKNHSVLWVFKKGKNAWKEY